MQYYEKKTSDKRYNSQDLQSSTTIQILAFQIHAARIRIVEFMNRYLFARALQTILDGHLIADQNVRSILSVPAIKHVSMKSVVTHVLVRVHSMLSVMYILIYLGVHVAWDTKEIHSLVVQKLFQVRTEYEKNSDRTLTHTPFVAFQLKLKLLNPATPVLAELMLFVRNEMGPAHVRVYLNTLAIPMLNVDLNVSWVSMMIFRS